MTGRHRSTAHRPGFTVRRPPRLVELVEAVTSTTHLITLDALAAGRKGRGRYIAVCGADVIPHALVAPPGPPCRTCRACTVPTPRRSS